MNYVILENIRSAYNVGSFFRTADALGRGVIISWYTPSPSNQIKVVKTSLGAEKTIPFIEFPNSEFDNTKAISWAKQNWYYIISAEITDKSISLQDFIKKNPDLIESSSQNIAVIFGNEVSWVSQEALNFSDEIVHIPMKWSKISLNVWQAWAIFMRELSKKN